MTICAHNGEIAERGPLRGICSGKLFAVMNLQDSNASSAEDF
jgi:hypothetical protein